MGESRGGGEMRRNRWVKVRVKKVKKLKNKSRRAIRLA